MQNPRAGRIAVIVPAYRVTNCVLDVLAAVPPEVSRIVVVDDACPDGSGRLVERECTDARVQVLFHEQNQGVGGAVMSGYRAAIDDGCDVMVRVDGDGPLDPGLLADLVRPILAGEADYTKGNRFFDLERVRAMPRRYVFGNALVSVMIKLSSGYWDLSDPTNGHTAIHARVARRLPFHRLSRRSFFEIDLLFRLNALRAVVVGVPMRAVAGDEFENLQLLRIVGAFLAKHVGNFGKRIFYNYYLRDLSLASIELVVGLGMFGFGVVFGGWHWIQNANAGTATPIGTVMLAALTTLMGLQFVLAFFAYDIAAVPQRPIHPRLAMGIRR